MTLLERLNAHLLASKEQLRQLEGGIEDLLKCAKEAGSAVGSEEYLAEIERCRETADKVRRSIDRLEKLRAGVRSRAPD